MENVLRKHLLEDFECIWISAKKLRTLGHGMRDTIKQNIKVYYVGFRVDISV